MIGILHRENSIDEFIITENSDKTLRTLGEEMNTYILSKKLNTSRSCFLYY